MSVTVDRVASVEAIAEDTRADAATAPGSVRSDLIKQVAHRANDQGIVFLLEAEALLGAQC